MDDELKQIIERGIAQGLSDDDIRLVVQAHQRQQQEQPVVSEKPISGEQYWRDQINRNDEFVRGKTPKLSDLTPIDIGLMALPPVVAGAARFGGPLLRAGATQVANALEQPLVAGAIGAAEGYRQGGLPGAAIGLITGGAASRFAKNLRPKDKPLAPETELGLTTPEATAARQASSVTAGPTNVVRTRGGGPVASPSQSAPTIDLGEDAARLRASSNITAGPANVDRVRAGGPPAQERPTLQLSADADQLRAATNVDAGPLSVERMRAGGPRAMPVSVSAESEMLGPLASHARASHSVLDGPATVNRVRGQVPGVVAAPSPPTPKPMRSSVRKTDGPESAGMREAGREGRQSYEDKAASDRMVRGMSQSRTAGSAPASTTTTQPTSAQTSPISASKSKRPTYTENDLKAAKEKWGSTDIADLREKHGQAVDDYLLAKRAERHQQHYSTNRELAAARKTDLDPLGATSELPPDVRAMLLDSLTKRSGK